MRINDATGLTEQLEAEINEMFEYRPGDRIAEALADVVGVIIDYVPPCADRSAAIRKLREAQWACDAAIRLGGKY